MMEAVQPILKVATAIQPAAAILAYIWEEVLKVEANREKLVDLARRIQRILGAIDEEIGKRPDQDMTRACNRLTRHMSFIKAVVERLGRMGFVRALIHRDDISRQIQECHNKMSDCLSLFQVSAAVDLRNYARDMKEAQERDQEILLKQLERLQSNDDEIMKVLKVVENQMEAMIAMQKNLAKQPDNSMERKLLTAGVAALQRSTNSKGISKPKDWALTSYDVEIDHSSKLGFGGFGCVKKGRFNHLVIAVKEMTKETDQKMLLREIQAWNKLRHDNVVPFYGASILATPPFLVSRYMKNGNVTGYLRKNPDANRVKLAHEIALGVLYIHTQNIIHGDLKGVNVLVDDAGIACITDFGLSTIKAHANSATAISVAVPKSGSTMISNDSIHIRGTLRYIAPEAFQGHVTKNVDVYAYAMTLYEIFTGEGPFLRIQDAYFFEFILNQKGRLVRPESQEVVDRGMSDDMWNLVMSCSAYSSRERPDFDTISSTTEMLKEEWHSPVVVLSPAEDDEMNELEELLGGMETNSPNNNNNSGQGTATLTNIDPSTGMNRSHLRSLSSGTGTSTSTSGQFQSLLGSPTGHDGRRQNSFGSQGSSNVTTAAFDIMAGVGMTLVNPTSPLRTPMSNESLNSQNFVSSRTLPPTPSGDYPILPREQDLERRRRILTSQVKNGYDMIKFSSYMRRISSTAFVSEGKKSWENFLSTILPHLETLENTLSTMKSGARVIQADLPGLWAERLSKRYTDFQYFALTVNDRAYTEAPKTAVNRFYHNDDRLMEDFDVSLWMALTSLDSDTYETNAALLRRGGVLMALVSKQGDKQLVSHPAFKIVNTWTALSRTREGVQTARFVVAERI